MNNLIYVRSYQRKARKAVKHSRKPKGLLSTTRGSVLFLILLISLIMLADVSFQKVMKTEFVVIGKPAVIRAVEATSSASFDQFVEEGKYHDIVVKVRELESNRGKNPNGLHVTCREKGMWNEVGYRAREGYCFKDEYSGTETTKAWFKKRMDKGYTEGEALCEWNVGIRTERCDYYENYKTLEI